LPERICVFHSSGVVEATTDTVVVDKATTRVVLSY